MLIFKIQSRIMRILAALSTALEAVNDHTIDAINCYISGILEKHIKFPQSLLEEVFKSIARFDSINHLNGTLH